MIHSNEEYNRTRDYVNRLEKMLLDLRQTHTERQYEQMSKAYLTELVKAQRDIAQYLAMPTLIEQKEAA